jgi:hypothetical protein
MAATGRQLKQSVNVFHNFMLYLGTRESQKLIEALVRRFWHADNRSRDPICLGKLPFRANENRLVYFFGATPARSPLQWINPLEEKSEKIYPKDLKDQVQGRRKFCSCTVVCIYSISTHTIVLFKLT